MLTAIIAALLALLGISFLGTINPAFLVMLFALVVVGVAVVGVVFFRLPPKFAIYAGIVSLGIALFMYLSAVTVIGMLLVAFTLFKFSPYKQPALFIALVGIGVALVIWGTKFVLIPMGVVP